MYKTMKVKKKKKRKRKGNATTPWIYEFGLFEKVELEIPSTYQFLVTFRNSSCEFLLESGRHEICLNWP